eukprot:TRINITY_DN14960_c0_g3_i1.p1 TRINITY_DN14960_c0_g3~~TRINITY_DN14960_c0_g3_i1.p1  ORF type:complete len:177 (+),score=33.16 TRINITY_DN14960_c0_g3_i1:78-608(+)
MDASSQRLTSAELMLDRINQLQQDKFELTRTIEEEQAHHNEKVLMLKEKIAELEKSEDMILQKHKEALLNKTTDSSIIKQAAHIGTKQNLLQGLVSQLNGQAKPPPTQVQLVPQHAYQYPAVVSTPSIGQEVRVRDTHTEPWKYGMLQGFDPSGRPLVRLQGWEKILSWNQVEIKP